MNSSLNELLKKYLNGQMNREDFERFVKKLEKNDVEDVEILKKLWEGLDQASYFSVSESKRILQDIKLKIHQEEHKRQAGRVFFFSSRWQRMAAVFLGFLVVSIICFLLLSRSNNHVYATDYGETKTIVLPDSSVVTLNANSTLSYHDHWEQDKSREVFLQGEAFFSVTHKENHQKFLVHTGQLDVEVFGTKFNVNHRRGSTRVMLSSGKVQLKSNTYKSLIMEPGELAVFSEEHKTFTKQTVEPHTHIAWTQGKLVFEDKPLQEIALILEDNYGFQVAFEEKSIAHEAFTGIIPADRVEVFFNMLSEYFEIIRKDKTIKISYKK